MDEHPNAKLIRSYVESLSTGDRDAMANALADDVEWHEIGRTEPIRGKTALAERYGMQGGTKPDWEITGGEIHDVIANDDHTIVLASAQARRGDETFEYRVAEIYHVKDGKVTARWAFSDDTERINRFFGGT